MPLYQKKDKYGNEKNIFFFHVPKNGGGSIKSFFHLNNFDKGAGPDYDHAVPNGDILKPYLNKRNTDFHFKFMIFRNPIDRILSEFKWLGNGIKNRNENGFPKFVKDVIEKVKVDRSIGNNHIRPQTDYFFEGTNIYLFGEFEKIISDLNDIVEIENKNFPHINKGINIDEFTIDDDTLSLIKDYYSKDFEFYKKISESKKIKLSKKDINVFRGTI